MQYKIKTEIFEGPIALLYEMIEKRNLSVSEFSLSLITDDFLHHIKTLKSQVENNLIYKNELSQFIHIASILVLLKSKSLLPDLEFTEEENRDVQILENQLKSFAILKERKNILKSMWNKNKLHSAKIKYKNEDKIFIPNIQLDKVLFYNYLQNKLNEIAPKENKKEVKVENRIKIEDALNHVRNIIKKLKKLNLNAFHENINGDVRLKEKNKKNIVVLFLAVLELTKIGEINVSQENLFTDIIVEENYA